MIAFVGSRNLSSRWAPLVALITGAAQSSGRHINVSCGSGLAALVRAACPGARVWSVKDPAFSCVPGRARWAARAAAMIRATAESGPGAGVVGFVVGPCPSNITPSRSWQSGRPVSGSWSELALAAGLGLPALVFWCNEDQPADLPDWPGFLWAPKPNTGWQLVAAPSRSVVRRLEVQLEMELTEDVPIARNAMRITGRLTPWSPGRFTQPARPLHDLTDDEFDHWLEGFPQ